MDWSQLQHFDRHELVCHHCGRESMDEDYMLRLDDLRHAFGKPILVTSGYRCPYHNDQVSSTGRDGPHTTGKASDVAVYGRDCYTLIRLALERGFTGIGLKQHGVHGRRFLHLDTLTDLGSAPRPWVWTYR